MRMAVDSHALPVYKKHRNASLLYIFETTKSFVRFIVVTIVIIHCIATLLRDNMYAKLERSNLKISVKYEKLFK